MNIMTIFRTLSFYTKRLEISRYGENKRSQLAPFRGSYFSPLIQTNLPSLMCICEKKTIAEELGLPEPPKKEMPGFFYFVKDKLSAYPDLLMKEKIKRLKLDWGKLKESEKLKYEDDYHKRLEAYQIKYKSYMDSLTPTQKEEMKRLRATRIQEKLTKKARLNRLKELKEAGKPEHPGLATSLFFKKLNSNKNEKAVLFRDALEKWNQSSEETKEAYKKEARDLLIEYKKKLAEWEKRMVQTGREHLVDKRSLSSK